MNPLTIEALYWECILIIFGTNWIGLFRISEITEPEISATNDLSPLQQKWLRQNSLDDPPSVDETYYNIRAYLPMKDGSSTVIRFLADMNNTIWFISIEDNDLKYQKKGNIFEFAPM